MADKLLGFDFEIVYKLGRDNVPAEALSRCPSGVYHALQAVSKPVIALFLALKQFFQHNPQASALLRSIQDQPGNHPHY